MGACGLLATLLVAIVLAGGCGDGRAGTGTGDAGPSVAAGVVATVVDGDTVRVRIGRSETAVRLLGIDTPEVRHPMDGVQCFGPEATSRAEELMPVGSSVRLETDPTQDRRDRYGRLLAYVYRTSAQGPAGSVNLALVASGHARTYVYGDAPFIHAERFLAAERAARGQGRGLWGPPCSGRTARPED